MKQLRSEVVLVHESAILRLGFQNQMMLSCVNMGKTDNSVSNHPRGFISIKIHTPSVEDRNKSETEGVRVLNE